MSYTHGKVTFELENEDEFLMGRIYQALQDDYEGEDIIVADDDNADRLTRECIEELLWAFTPEFLASETGLPEEVFQALADSGRCESNNEAIMALLEQTCGMEAFVSSAIDADGRGHFLSGYDGEEGEIEIDGDIYYVYRQ
jgi:hypothetical protein